MLRQDVGRSHGCRPGLPVEEALSTTISLVSDTVCVIAVMDHLDFGQAAEELTQAAEYLRKQGAAKVSQTI